MLEVSETGLLDITRTLYEVISPRVDPKECKLGTASTLVTLEWSRARKRRVDDVELLVTPVVKLNQPV
jgi:hypothetical protein